MSTAHILAVSLLLSVGTVQGYPSPPGFLPHIICLVLIYNVSFAVQWILLSFVAFVSQLFLALFPFFVSSLLDDLGPLLPLPPPQAHFFSWLMS